LTKDNVIAHHTPVGDKIPVVVLLITNDDTLIANRTKQTFHRQGCGCLITPNAVKRSSVTVTMRNTDSIG